jgi:hypothetical protein
LQDEDQYLFIFDLADQPIVSHPILPEFTEALPLQGLPNAARVVEMRETRGKKLHNAPGVLWVESA